MREQLQGIEVSKRPSRVRLPGRVLFLVDDAELIRRQLQGEDLELTDELRAKLRDQISTDEITPAYICYYFDETLGQFPYLGLRAGGEAPITRGSVKQGGFVCSVSGKRRGKGSSREQSPYAELMAGIRVVIAENIERIYNENCQNLGILTSTDFSLVGRIRAGEEVPLEVFTEGADEITRQIIEYGGLFEFNVARLQGKVEIPAVEAQVGPMADHDTDSHDPEQTRKLKGAGDASVSPDAWSAEDAMEQAEATSRATPHVTQAASEAAPPRRGRRAMTIAEKIFARAWVVNAAEGRHGVAWVKPGDSGFVRTDYRFSHEYVTPMAAIFFEEKLGADARVNDPSTIIMFRDHLTYLHQVMPPERVQLGLLDVARQLKDKQEAFAKKQGVVYFGERMGLRLGSEAICHSKMLESYAEPGQLIVGTDSHTPHSGAIGAIAFGVGTTAIFNSWITRDVRVSVPPSFKVVIRGAKPDNVTAKDFMLEILRHPYIKEGHAIGQIIEYAGDAVEALSVDERATMTNMAAEVGAFTGIVAPDAKAVEFLVEQRGMPRARAEALCEGLHSDPDAGYVKVIEIDAAEVRPMVALPGDPGHGLYVDELGGEPVRLDTAYAGSCTAGKKEDMDMYAAVLREARAEGLRVHPDVKMFIQCGSQEVRAYCEQEGYLALFEDMGAEFIEPGCGACIAAGPGTSRGTEEVTISSQNRNFPGRS
ncbi:MAG TPA: aconitase family protein, partial [Longimicrobiales bacterium]|nr:aconitase family protein [Longimicrobiales bacterium]